MLVKEQSESADAAARFENAMTGESKKPSAAIALGLFTGGQDRPYALGLAMALVGKGVSLDIIGSDEVDSPEFHSTPQVKFLNLRGNQQGGVGLTKKVSRLLGYYWRLILYAATAKPKVFHILWNNKFEYFDRTVLMIYYRLLGKKITFTAHNVNAGRRDGRDSWLNRLTLRIQYHLAGHLFVHTEKMKAELIEDFGVREKAITLFSYPINDVFPDTDLTPAEAKDKLGIESGAKTLLFFGRIVPYKGLEHLIAAFELIAANDKNYRLIVAGERKKGSEEYTTLIETMIRAGVEAGRILPRLKFIPDEETEIYFKAADVLVLPYKDIYQSGVLFVAYGFGLPVLATDVGSFRETIQPGKTGMVCRSCDPHDLAEGIETYFASDLYKNLDARRSDIRDYAHLHHSWDAAAGLTRDAYLELIER